MAAVRPLHTAVHQAVLSSDTHHRTPTGSGPIIVHMLRLMSAEALAFSDGRATDIYTLIQLAPSKDSLSAQFSILLRWNNTIWSPGDIITHLPPLTGGRTLPRLEAAITPHLHDGLTQLHHRHTWMPQHIFSAYHMGNPETHDITAQYFHPTRALTAIETAMAEWRHDLTHHGTIRPPATTIATFPIGA